MSPTANGQAGGRGGGAGGVGGGTGVVAGVGGRGTLNHHHGRVEIDLRGADVKPRVEWLAILLPGEGEGLVPLLHQTRGLGAHPCSGALGEGQGSQPGRHCNTHTLTLTRSKGKKGSVATIHDGSLYGDPEVAFKWARWK